MKMKSLGRRCSKCQEMQLEKTEMGDMIQNWRCCSAHMCHEIVSREAGPRRLRRGFFGGFTRIPPEFWGLGYSSALCPSGGSTVTFACD